MAMQRADFVRRKITEVDIQDYGTVRVKSLSIASRARIIQASSNEEGEIDREHFARDMILASVVDDDGNLCLQPSDIDEMDALLVERLANAIAQLIRPDAAAKN